MSETTLISVAIKTVDVEKQIVYGEVYCPNVLDTHGEMMLPGDVIKMAERFADLDWDEAIDLMHNNRPQQVRPIESFVAKSDDDFWTPGAWVLGCKVNDPQLWEGVKNGTWNGYSFEARVKKVPAVVDLEFVKENLGTTEEAEGHRHFFVVRLNDDGVVVAGRTSTDDGHSHEVKQGTATEETNGHSHRFFL